jgi:hypothetical protein
MNKLMKVIGEVDKKPLELIEKWYFEPDLTVEANVRTKKVIKNFIRLVFINQNRENNKEV